MTAAARAAFVGSFRIGCRWDSMRGFGACPTSR